VTETDNVVQLAPYLAKRERDPERDRLVAAKVARSFLRWVRTHPGDARRVPRRLLSNGRREPGWMSVWRETDAKLEEMCERAGVDSDLVYDVLNNPRRRARRK
jgi:hypothetical protein